MGAAAGKFAEWTVLGGYFAILLALAFISFPWLPDLLHMMLTAVGQMVSGVLTDTFAALWQEADTRTVVIGIAAVAGVLMMIMAGAAFEAIDGMVYWEMTTFRGVLWEHTGWLDIYVASTMPQLQSDYSRLSDRKVKISLLRPFGRGNKSCGLRFAETPLCG